METAPRKRMSKYIEDNDRPGFFREYYQNVRDSVTVNCINEFSQLKSDEDKIRFVFKLPVVHEIDLKPFYRGKSEREALEKKEEGNKAFIYKKNYEALKLYSQAVVKAPVPSGKYWKLIKENADPKKMSLYAICLANRSAALWCIQDYYHCFRDIEEALNHHYPKELKYKLYKRKGRILLQYKRHEDARDAFRQAMKWLDWAKMDRENRIEKSNGIKKWLQMLEGAKVCKNEPWPDESQIPKVPELCNGPNEKFPALSSKVRIEYSKTGGRYVVANTKIEAGDVICAEKAYASVLYNEEAGKHCQNCLATTIAPIPCKLCSGVLFCSAACRDACLGHRVECPIVDLLRGTGMSINGFLALRLLTQTPLAFFMDNRDRINEEDPKAILDLGMPYLGSSFQRLFHLVHHGGQRTVEDTFHRTIFATLLVKCLKKTKYFIDVQSSGSDSVSDAEAFVGSLLLRFTQVVQFNAHEVSEYVFEKSKEIESARNASLGAAIYPSLALFNHDCNTAQVRYFCGHSVVTKAVRPLEAGEMVPENYGQTYSSKERWERRADLQDRYWFDCNCQACRENWPMYKDTDNSLLRFKCKTCSAPLEVDTNTVSPFFTCNHCNKETNILAALKSLTNTEEIFKKATDEMAAYNLDEAERLLLENLKQLNENLYPPYKDYHLIQEALMKCNLCRGNKRIKFEDKLQ